MAVFIVTALSPNGNARSCPIVAGDAAAAIADYRRDVHEDEQDMTGFTFEARQAEDIEGRYELALLDAERRRLEDEYYRMPARKARRR